jgi:hypothetical protein
VRVEQKRGLGCAAASRARTITASRSIGRTPQDARALDIPQIVPAFWIVFCAGGPRQPGRIARDVWALRGDRWRLVLGQLCRVAITAGEGAQTGLNLH